MQVKKLSRVFILSIYPAPYRLDLFCALRKSFDIDVFFEHHKGDGRNMDWFAVGDYYLLDTPEGKKRYWECIRRLKEYDMVALYDFTTQRAINLIIMCQLCNVGYVVNCDGVIMIPHKNVLKDIIKRYLVSSAVACLASGEHAKQYFMKLGVREGRVYTHKFSSLNETDILSSPISHNEKTRIRYMLSLPTEAKIAIAVGRFIPLKRYRELISAWKNMPGNYYLLIVGEGKEKESYEALIKNKQINNVIIEDYKPKEFLYDYYKASDVFIHPTLYDAWGLVVNEAMACGLPVVVSSQCVAGLELVREGVNGHLVATGQEDLLCERARLIFEDDELRQNMAQSSLNAIRDFTISNMAAVHRNVFDGIIYEHNDH